MDQEKAQLSAGISITNQESREFYPRVPTSCRRLAKEFPQVLSGDFFPNNSILNRTLFQHYFCSCVPIFPVLLSLPLTLLSAGSMGSMGFSAMPSVLSPTASSDAYHSASSTASSVWSSVVGGLSKKDSEEDQAKGVTRLKDGTVIARTDGDHTKAVSEFSNTRRQYEEERKRDAEVERQRKEAEAARAAALAAGGEAAAEPVPWGGGKPAAPKAGGFAAQKLAKWRVRAEDKKPGTQASEPKPFPGAAGAAQSKSTERGSGRAKSVEQSRTARGGFGGGGGEGGARWKQAKGNFLGRMKAGLNPKRKVAKHKYPLQWNPVKGRWGCDVCGKGMEGGGDRFRSTEPGVDFDSCRECFMKGELVK